MMAALWPVSSFAASQVTTAQVQPHEASLIPAPPPGHKDLQIESDRKKISRVLDVFAAGLVICVAYTLIYRREKFLPRLASSYKVTIAIYVYWVMILLYTNALEFQGILSWAAAVHAWGLPFFKWSLQDADSARFITLGLAPVALWLVYCLKTGYRYWK